MCIRDRENRPGQGAGEQRGGVRRESAGVALVELAVLAPAQNQQRGRHRRRDKDHGPQTGGAGDGPVSYTHLFFRPVLETIGPYDREELLLIGDSLTSDMEGGSRAGIPCCWYNPKGLPRPDRPAIRYEVRNLNQVREIVAGKC